MKRSTRHSRAAARAQLVVPFGQTRVAVSTLSMTPWLFRTVSREISQLEAGDATAIEMAVRFLEADPYFFRSGYHKEDFIKHLCKNPLSEDQKKRLQEVIFARIRGRDRREFRAYCRLARVVTEPAFQKQVAEMAGPSNETVPRHAKRVLEYLESTPAKSSRRDVGRSTFRI